MSLTANSTATKWQRMIGDLQEKGFTYERIAIECQLRGVGYTPMAVKLLKLGYRDSPYYDPGEVIVSLHTKYCRTTLPSE